MEFNHGMVFSYFSFRPVVGDKLTAIGTVLLLLVCENSSDKVLGMCAVHGTEIPHLYAHIESLSQQNVPERKKLTRSLFLQKESLVLKEVEQRVEARDQDMTDFYKANKRIFSAQVVATYSRPRSRPYDVSMSIHSKN